MYPLSSWLNTQTEQGLRRTPHPTLDALMADTCFDFASNDYLSLARQGLPEPTTHTPLHQGYLYGAGSARLVAGTHDAILKLEARIAHWKHTESCVIFPTGFQANISAIPALVYPTPSRHVWLLSDKLNHASLNEGCRLATLEGATWKRYRHHDLPQLERLLQQVHHEAKAKGYKYPEVWIMTESVFSMDGDIAPLESLCTLADRYGAKLYLDEAHAAGVMGPEGQGLAHALGCHTKPCLQEGIQMGTFSKAMGCMGGYIAGSHDLTQLMWQRAKGLIYTTALPPLLIDHLHHVLDWLMTPTITLSSHATAEATPSQHFQTGLKQAQSLFEPLKASLAVTPQTSFTIPDAWFQSPVEASPLCFSPIVPVYAPSIETLLTMKDTLMTKRFLVGAIRPPTVPQGTQRLRISLHAHNDLETLQALLRCLHP